MSFALSLAARVLLALLLGVHLTRYIEIIPVLRAMDAGLYVPVKRALDSTSPRLVKPLMLASLAAPVAAVIAASIAGPTTVAVADGVSLVALMVALLAIQRIDLPINEDMMNWSPVDTPADWRATRARWERFLAVRVAANTLALLTLGIVVASSAAGLGGCPRGCRSLRSLAGPDCSSTMSLTCPA